MPMIDIYAVAGTFRDKHTLAKDLANAVMRWKGCLRSRCSKTTRRRSFTSCRLLLKTNPLTNPPRGV
jgi:hypothetical protein